jgi:hypothetical protein
MATIKIDDLDWFDSDSCSELTEDEAQTIQGGRLPGGGGGGTWRPPQPPPPPFFISPLPAPTTPIGPTVGLPPSKPKFP